MTNRKEIVFRTHPETFYGGLLQNGAPRHQFLGEKA